MKVTPEILGNLQKKLNAESKRLYNLNYDATNKVMLAMVVDANYTPKTEMKIIPISQFESFNAIYRLLHSLITYNRLEKK